jgi:hypothetical protein
MAKIGRPEKPIDWKIFEDLCNIQCTAEEIASVCKVDRHTLYDRVKKQYEEEFPTVYKKYTEGGKTSIRRMQFKLAQKNTAMAIWLGKQYLGQRDHQEKEESPKQEDLDLKQKYYASQYELQQLKQKFNDLKPQTNSELQPSHS